jgi:RNA polymerase sigma-70 factor (ECF subfamily)
MVTIRETTTEAVWGTLHDRLRRFIRARVEDDASADDILQDVFLTIHERIDSLRDGERLDGWVWRIARNAVVDHYRARRPPAALPLTLVAPEAATLDEDDATRCLVHSVRGMLDALPEPYREALLLTDYGGLTQRRLAERTGISVSGAKSRVQRAREKLKALLLACCHVGIDRRGGVIDCRPRTGRGCGAGNRCAGAGPA